MLFEEENKRGIEKLVFASWHPEISILLLILKGAKVGRA